MIPAISQVCVLGSDWDVDLQEFRAAGFVAAECWLTKLETFLARSSVDAARAHLESLPMALPVASAQGGLLASTGEAFEAAWQLFQSRLKLMHTMGISTLVITADVPYPASGDVVSLVVQRLTEATRLAEHARIRLALEFHARSAFINNLQTAVSVVDEIHSAHLGICLDTFHMQLGPTKHQDLQLLTSENLFHVQVADIADRLREFAGDADRIFPGDGELPWPEILAHLRAIGYDGLISLELLNPNFSQVSADQLAFLAQQMFARWFE